jgi:hypothetical protein
MAMRWRKVCSHAGPNMTFNHHHSTAHDYSGKELKTPWSRRVFTERGTSNSSENRPIVRRAWALFGCWWLRSVILQEILLQKDVVMDRKNVEFHVENHKIAADL